MQVYICEHCKRRMLSAGAMSLHERQCKDNPNNQHKCFQWCKHLVKTTGQIEYDNTNLNTVFTCKLRPELGQLYSYKLERFACHSEIIKSMKRMPLECDKYQDGQYGDSDIDLTDFDW